MPPMPKALTAKELDRAAARGRQLALTEPRAARARYDKRTSRIIVDLTNGCTLAVPARTLQGLAKASDAELAEVEILGTGYGLHWESLDADFTVPGLLRGVFGTRAWMSELARRAGQTRSPAKAAAARANGRKGGRPRSKATSS